MIILKSIALFILAGLCEIGGGYLIWLWLREDKPYYYGILGGIILALYGIVATLQTADFAKVYVAYGGVFIVLSLIWAYKMDNYSPDKFDIIGASVALAGVCIIYYAPRNLS
jgi:small multidrug resistance family-3 protein